jgi:chromosomal replication initiation ATPase DnaA
MWWLLKHHPERYFSYPDIAQMFRRSDHTTILSGVRAHERRYGNERGGVYWPEDEA